MVSTSNEVIGKVGTNVEYAAYHEYGFSGSVSVAAHVRHLKDGRIQNVGAHTRNVNYPARSFLRAALKSFAPQIREELHAAVSLAISKTMG
jgi:phage gpG-like protein